jgi:hypothetical protein
MLIPPVNRAFFMPKKIHPRPMAQLGNQLRHLPHDVYIIYTHFLKKSTGFKKNVNI